jgi:hypothetical protein
MRMPPPPAMLQPYDPTRGQISCFTTQQGVAGADLISAAIEETLRDLLVDHYVEAFRRLPLDDVPDLSKLIDFGGLCLGLLDPVANIVLNTISFLPQGFKTNPSVKIPSPRCHERSRHYNTVVDMGHFDAPIDK